MAIVLDIDRGWRSFRRVIGDAQGRTVEVGFVDGEIATYAAVNEYGARIRGGFIPPRPFMRTTIDTNAERYAALIRQQVARAIAQRAGSVEGALLRVGLTVRNDLIKAIRSWAEPPNAPSTIRRKGVNNPLVDTAAMQRAITVEVTKGAP